MATQLDEHPIAVQFAAWMTGSPEAGAAVLAAVEPAPDLIARLAALVRRFMAYRGSVNLDEALGRYDPTAVLDLHHPLIRGDVRRLHVLQRELQRTCLTAALLNVPAAQRAAFVLLDILRLPRAQAAAVFGGEGALKTNHMRARRALDAYLAPRCEHVNPDNGCRCDRRLAVAVDRGFVTWPERDDLAGDVPLRSRGHSEVSDLYASLPSPDPGARRDVHA